MSLLVSAYRRDAAGGMERLAVEPPWNDLAGVELWRTEVWGSAAARGLGLVMLPSLAEGDVYAEGEELDALERETEVLLGNLAGVSADVEGLRFRVENVRAAIRAARAAGGGVYIG